MANPRRLSYETCVSVFLVLLPFSAAWSKDQCPPCPGDEVCVKACGDAFCQGYLPETVKPGCASATLTIGTKRLQIQKLPDKSMRIQKLPDLNTQ
jgi:hypothetical protein